MAERKWAMTRLAAGDYLLPSNDRQTIWRIGTYEDGPGYGLEVDWSDRTFWGVWRWAGSTATPETVADLEDWGRWQLCAGMLGTRREAIDAALDQQG